jgi:hypothetical protein
MGFQSDTTPQTVNPFTTSGAQYELRSKDSFAFTMAKILPHRQMGITELPHTYNGTVALIHLLFGGLLYVFGGKLLFGTPVLWSCTWCRFDI